MARQATEGRNQEIKAITSFAKKNDDPEPGGNL